MRDRILVALYLLAAALPIAVKYAHVKPHPIFGALEAPQRPVLTFASVTSETFQDEYVKYFEATLRTRGYSMWLDNTALDLVFGETKPGSRVAIGDERTLFEREDIDAFNRTPAEVKELLARVDHFADQIAQTQQRLARDGRAFVPIMVPSKAAVFRDHIPSRWKRDPEPPTDAIYPAIRAALDKRHVIYVDSTADYVREPRERMWTTDARHWSHYAGCLALKSALALAPQLGGPRVDYDCPYKPELVGPTHVDFDLWRLLNDASHRTTHVVPMVAHTPPPADAVKPSMLLIGTSFEWTLLRDADWSKRFGALYMNYYNKLFVEWPADIHTTIVAHDDYWKKVALGRDIYIMDLYEPYLPLDGAALDDLMAELK